MSPPPPPPPPPPPLCLPSFNRKGKKKKLDEFFDENYRERNSSPNGRPSQPTGVNDKLRRLLKGDVYGEGEVARLERERLVELERHLSAMLAEQTRRDQRLAQLTDELALKSALLKQAEANAAESMKRAELVVGLERQLSATLAVQTRRDQRVAQLTDKLALKSFLLEQAETNAAEASKRTGLGHTDRLLVQVAQKDAELAGMQAKLDELLLSRDQHVRALERAQSALQKATSHAADADNRSQRACEQIRKYETELTEMRAKLETRESELEAVRLRLADAENGWAKSETAKSETEADTLHAMAIAGPVSTGGDQIMRGLMERMRTMEYEMASLRMNEKSSEDMQTRNEG